MRCTVYRSNTKAFTYLYLADTVKLEDLPDSLIGLFGEPTPVMCLDLEGRDQLAHADIETVRKSLREEGYYLQLPPEESVEDEISRRFS